ncbi:hypothetical protein F4803DRAFT_566839 [Xylaria telfairii]|nr:hypothetical protein F4803DRAFT_566839 [Xylaria telfairii]
MYATITNPNPPFGDAPSCVALIGGRGYTGQALVELLDKHPYIDLHYVSSRELVGQELKGYSKRKVIYDNLSPKGCMQLDIDAYILSLPNGVLEKDKDKKSVIIDLSADHRFDDTCNPGYYLCATIAQLAIAPIIDLIATNPTIVGISGYSGTGTTKSLENDVAYSTGGLPPYSLTEHIHEREITHHTTDVAWFRGIHETINIPVNKSMNSRDIRNIYQDRYAGEKLIKVVGEAPYVKTIQNEDGVEIGGFAIDKTGKRVVM